MGRIAMLKSTKTSMIPDDLHPQPYITLRKEYAVKTGQIASDGQAMYDRPSGPATKAWAFYYHVRSTSAALTCCRLCHCSVACKTSVQIRRVSQRAALTQGAMFPNR